LYRKAKNIQIYIKTDRLADWLPTDINIGRQAGQQAGRQKDRKTDRQTDRQTYRQTNRQTERQTSKLYQYCMHCTILGGGP
jgi:hypothetical protein